jgi:hypothetical protein
VVEDLALVRRDLDKVQFEAEFLQIHAVAAIIDSLKGHLAATDDALRVAQTRADEEKLMLHDSVSCEFVLGLPLSLSFKT